MKQLIVLTLALMVTLAFGTTEAEARTTFVTIGTGGVTGVYYPTGGAISKMVNKKRRDYGIRATVESTGGSVFNVNSVMNGDMEFGIVQSDRQYQALKGLGEWQGKPQEKLRAVFAIHPETVTLIAAVDKNIQSPADLKGKIVNIGAPGTGQRGNALDLFAAVGIDADKDLRVEGTKPAEAAKLLQDGRIDAFFYTVGHPNGSIKEAVAGARQVAFVPVDAELATRLSAKSPYYAPSKIEIKNYPGIGNSADVPGFGVKATLCTSADVSDEVVYAITKEVFENFEDFKKLHPAYSVLTKESMLQGLSAPIHPGAMKYYREAGLL